MMNGDDPTVVNTPQPLGEGSRAPPTLPMAPGGLGEQPDDRIGPYHLLQVIGEGGFGVVWLAERRKPMVQRVALKIIKPGMDSKSVVARFEQERQALAVMDHPNVARVFDGGVTPSGRPYFVMEHVQGEPITDFCDRHRLTIKQRLELFIPVCEAVQHAHHKGLIHRDLKPSNILVAEIEGKAVPKVIDFGVAKAVASEGWANTAHTQAGMVIGTPEYMSPEQVAGEIDVDTRSDVYALGVVLYELLTGELPFDSQELRMAALVEIARIIKEVTPPKPSTRLGQLVGDRTTTIANSRSTSSKLLTSELRRELDWIPLMALRKERERRYASAGEFAEDVQRYLVGLPLLAAPESRIYLTRKFVRRNRVQVLSGAAAFLALAIGLAAAIWQANEAAKKRDEAVLAGQKEANERARADERAYAAERAEQAAEAARDAERERAVQLQKVSDFQSRMLAQIDTTKAGIDLMTDVRERFVAALEKAHVPEEERTARVDALRKELVHVNATDAAAAMIDRTILRPAIITIDTQFKDDPVTDASLRQSLADLYRTISLYEAAMPLQESALATRRRVLGEEHPETIRSINQMGLLLDSQGKLIDAEPYYIEAASKSQRELGEDHPSTLDYLSNIGNLLRARGNFDQAEPYILETLEKRRRVLGQEHPKTLISINIAGLLRQDQGRFNEAEMFRREALEKARRVLGEEHPSTLTQINNMGSLLRAQGKLNEAEPYFREALEKSRRVLGEEHPNTLTTIGNIGYLLLVRGKLAEAESYLREDLEMSRRVLGEEHPDTLISSSIMGLLLRRQGKLDEAELYFRETLERRRRVLGEDHPDTLSSINSMGGLLIAQGKLAEVEPYFREALEKYRRVLGEEHPDTLNSISNMGGLLRAQDRLNEAEPYLREALEKRRRLLGEEHPQTLGAINSMGALLRAQGRHQDAIDLLLPVEPAARKAFSGGSTWRLADFFTSLGRARVALGYDAERYQLAESNLLEAHPIYLASASHGPTHKDALACVQALIDLYTAWHAAEPDKGYDSKATEWQAMLSAAKAAQP